jgi:signal transduction histidine kinase
MKSPFGVRLWILIAALLVVAGGTIYGLSSEWSRVRQLEAKLTGSQFESFRLAGEVQRGLLNLNNSMLRYALTRSPGQWERFDNASKDLDHWIDQHDPALNPHSPLTTANERELFAELNRSYDEYLAAAQAVHSNAQPALVTSGQFTQLNAFDAQAEHIRELARKLADAHRAAEAGFLADANEALLHLRVFLTSGVVLLLALIAALGWVIYRDAIAPLRTKLVQSQTLLEAQEKLATLGTLAAGIAHEIRNPLTSLKARLYTLEKHLQTVPAARKDTDIITAEISRLERIVQDVLGFARPSDPRIEPLSVQSVFTELQGLMSPTLENRGVELAIESSPQLQIHADRGHIKQVLINLVNNAADAIDGPGLIVLRARAARATLGAREVDVVILEVSDSGKGIPPEVEKRLFDPFFTTKDTGTGLGLKIAARIIEKHGGRLQYRTQPGRGTTFGVVLPHEFKQTPTCATRDADRNS